VEKMHDGKGFRDQCVDGNVFMDPSRKKKSLIGPSH